MQGPRWLDYLLVPLLYFAAAKFAIAYTTMPEGIVTLWLANSVLLAALIRFQGRGYFYFAGLIIATEIIADVPTFSLIEAVLFGIVNVGEATIAFLLLRRSRFNPQFSEVRDLAKFVFAGPVLASLVAAICGASIYSYFRTTDTSYLEFFRLWWFGDALGLMVLTPMLLNFWPFADKRPTTCRAIAWQDYIVALGAIAATVLLMLAENGTVLGVHVGPILILPFVLYVAVRFNLHWASLAAVAASMLVVVLSTGGHQLFAQLPQRETVIAVQEFILITCLMTFGLTALLSELRAKQSQLEHVNRQLGELNQDLEQRVSERTAELQTSNTRLEELATTDPLTGVRNRRALIELINQEIKRCRRHWRTLAIVMFDIDGFKSVNDRHGHEAGDIVLKKLVSQMGPLVRQTDTLARYGGEEFVLIAPDTDQREALLLAERMRLTLRSMEISFDDTTLHVTASFGVVLLSLHDKDPDELLRRADRALHTAKHAGRNRVVFQ